MQFLTFIDLEDITIFVDVLEKITLNHAIAYEISQILKYISMKEEQLDDRLKAQLILIISKYLNEIVEQDLVVEYRKTFFVFSEVLRICSDKTIVIIDKIRLILLDVLYGEKKIEEFAKLFEFIRYFYNFLDVKQQRDILDAFEKYENNCTESHHFNDIIGLMMDHIYNFPNLQDLIYNDLVQRINQDNNNVARSYPDMTAMNLSKLYNLSKEGYFNEKSILTDITSNIRGIFPEVDWKWFRDRGDETIERFLKRRTVSNIKKYFAENDEDLKIIDEYIIKKYSEETERIKLW